MTPTAVIPERPAARLHGDGSRHSIATVQRARALHEAGWTATEIQRLLVNEGRPQPSLTTVKRWTNPQYAENQRQTVRRCVGSERAKAATFRLSGDTDHYRRAFIERLCAEGVSRDAIERVCRVVLEMGGAEVRGVLDSVDTSTATPLLDRMRALSDAGARHRAITIALRIYDGVALSDEMVRYYLKTGREPRLPKLRDTRRPRGSKDDAALEFEVGGCR